MYLSYSNLTTRSLVSLFIPSLRNWSWFQRILCDQMTCGDRWQSATWHAFVSGIGTLKSNTWTSFSQTSGWISHIDTYLNHIGQNIPGYSNQDPSLAYPPKMVRVFYSPCFLVISPTLQDPGRCWPPAEKSCAPRRGVRLGDGGHRWTSVDAEQCQVPMWIRTASGGLLTAGPMGYPPQKEWGDELRWVDVGWLMWFDVIQQFPDLFGIRHPYWFLLYPFVSVVSMPLLPEFGAEAGCGPANWSYSCGWRSPAQWGEDGPKIWYAPSKQLQGLPDLSFTSRVMPEGCVMSPVNCKTIPQYATCSIDDIFLGRRVNYVSHMWGWYAVGNGQWHSRTAHNVLGLLRCCPDFDFARNGWWPKQVAGERSAGLVTAPLQTVLCKDPFVCKAQMRRAQGL